MNAVLEELPRSIKEADAAADRDNDVLQRVLAERRGKEATRMSTSGPSERNVVALEATDFLGLALPPRENLLSPWLPNQGLCMAHGPRGVGKTMWELGIAVAVATGTKFLNWEAPKPAGVLLLDGEMPANTMQERLVRAIASAGVDLLAPLRIVTPDLQPREQGSLNLADESWQDALEPLLDGISLIICDNISTLVRGGRENESESWGAAQGWALRMRASGRSVLWIHHSGKGGDQRGTSRREDVLDTVIALRRPPDYEATEGAHFELTYTKSRGFYGDDAEPLDVRLDTMPDGRQEWTWAKLEGVSEAKIGELKQSGMSVREIGNELGLSKSAVHRRLKALGMEGGK